jgi:hypothetical protein
MPRRRHRKHGQNLLIVEKSLRWFGLIFLLTAAIQSFAGLTRFHWKFPWKIKVQYARNRTLRLEPRKTTGAFRPSLDRYLGAQPRFT